MRRRVRKKGSLALLWMTGGGERADRKGKTRSALRLTEAHNADMEATLCITEEKLRTARPGF